MTADLARVLSLAFLAGLASGVVVASTALKQPAEPLSACPKPAITPPIEAVFFIPTGRS